MQTSEVLNLAADLIQKKGHWKGGQWDGGTCAANAITDSQGNVSNLEPYHALCGYLGKSDIGDIFEWNDAPGRTAAEVIEVLRACAVIEAARQEQDAAWETYAGLVTA